MSQKNRGSSEGQACERFVSRMLHRDTHKFSLRAGPKQQNMPTPQKTVAAQKKPPTAPLPQHEYVEDDGFLEVTVKRSNPRGAQREPWGQVLSQRRGDERSVFGSFDPLRTLHFLVKELQIQLQSVLPDESTVQQMVSDIQHALKRVPPEIVSSVHLQQALPHLPIRKSSQTNCEHFEKLKPSGFEKDTQTIPSNVNYPKGNMDQIQLQQLMEENTKKLEESCKTMELVCTKLKNEKEQLEKEVKKLRNEILTSRNAHEDESAKLKHQLRISEIEKEKYVAILAVRDRQIAEIRAEMAQLQEAVNEQLAELRGNAGILSQGDDQRNIADHDKIGDASISTIFSNEDRMRQFFLPDQENSFHNLPSGDAEDLNVFQKAEELLRERKDSDHDQGLNNKLERLDSQASIRSMFKEIKKTAYAVVSTPKTKKEIYGEK